MMIVVIVKVATIAILKAILQVKVKLIERVEIKTMEIQQTLTLKRSAKLLFQSVIYRKSQTLIFIIFAIIDLCFQ